MHPANPIEAYRPVIASLEEYLYGGSGRQPGDPARAAEAMIAVVESDHTPLHFILGEDATGAWKVKVANVAGDLQSWRDQANGTEFPDAEIRSVGRR